jgi:tripartite-type tricarboxylate transporter receptor subunit TctC
VSRGTGADKPRNLAKTVIVENQGGRGGTVALATVARALADDYTLALTATASGASPFPYRKLPYDPETAFPPISQIVTFYNVLVTYPGLPAKTLPKFMNYAKSNPVSLGGGNIGGQSWIMLTKLNSMAGTKIESIPYKGTGPALSDCPRRIWTRQLPERSCLKVAISCALHVRR